MKYYELELNYKFINKISIISTILFVILLLYTIFEGGIFSACTFIALLFLTYVIHEIIHGIGFVIFGKAKYDKIKYGYDDSKKIFYCACYDLIKKKGLMLSLLLPVFVISILYFYLGYKYDIDILYFIGIIHLFGSSVDIMMTYFLHFLPNDTLYIDGPNLKTHLILNKNYEFVCDSIVVNAVSSGVYKKGLYEKLGNEKIKIDYKFDKKRFIITLISAVILFVILDMIK